MTTIATSALSALTALDQWVCWRRELRGGKPTKVPYNARTGTKAAVGDSLTWSSHAAAVAAAGRYDGIGFVMTPEDDIAGVDLDKCRNPETGEIDSWAQNIITRVNSYTEVSPSNTGIRIFLRGVLPPGRRRRGHSETYDRDRYLTVTGRHVDCTPETIEERRAELAAVHAAMFPHTETPPAEEREPQPVDLVDAELLERMTRAKNGDTFLRLWDGVIDEGRHSESDLALCGMLAFWTGRDAARIDRLFRGSRLFRPKWDERRGDTTYGAMTIKKAMERCATVYQPTDTFPVVEVDPCVLNGKDHHHAELDGFHIVTSDRSLVTRYVRYARQRTDAPRRALQRSSST